MRKKYNRKDDLIDALTIGIVGLFGIGALLVDKKLELEREKIKTSKGNKCDDTTSVG